MRIQDMKPLNQLAEFYGVKMVGYGKPGTGKTPLLITAPRAGGMITEPGLLTLKNQQTNVYGIGRYTFAEIEDFFAWVFGSNERKNFDTLFIDSVSQWAEIYTSHYLSKNKDGRKAYGEMARNVLEKLEKLYFLKECHIVLICKLEVTDGGENGQVYRPYLPGKELHVRMPHMFDEILWLDNHDIPGMGRTRSLRCWPTYGAVCRDRSMKLAEYEPADLTHVFNKIMA